MITDKGTINAEHVVNAGGLWAREVGRMVGLELPVLAMEHMYLVTDEMPEVVAFNKERGHELPHAIDFKAEIYMRQERTGMVLGTYEKACVPWQPRRRRGISAPSCCRRISTASRPSLELGYPALPGDGEGRHQARHQRAVHLLARRQSAGRARCRACPDFWCACAVMAGFSQGGGVGLALSQWMVNGDPGFDVWAMDVARYGEWATRSYTNQKGARELLAPLLDPLPQ